MEESLRDCAIDGFCNDFGESETRWKRRKERKERNARNIGNSGNARSTRNSRSARNNERKEKMETRRSGKDHLPKSRLKTKSKSRSISNSSNSLNSLNSVTSLNSSCSKSDSAKACKSENTNRNKNENKSTKKKKTSEKSSNIKKMNGDESNCNMKYSDYQYTCDRYIPARDDCMDSKTDKSQLFNMVDANNNNNSNKNNLSDVSNTNENTSMNGTNGTNGMNSMNSMNNDDESMNRSRQTRQIRQTRQTRPTRQATPEKQYDSCLQRSLLSRQNGMNGMNGINGINGQTQRSNVDSMKSMNSSNNMCSKMNRNGNGDSNNDTSCTSSILTFKDKAPLPSQDFNSHLRAIYTVSGGVSAMCGMKKKDENNNHNKMCVNGRNKRVRFVNESAERILDAPDLADNFYLNLLDWSSKNVIGIGLGNSLYLWNAGSGEAKLLFESSDDSMISSVAWTHTGTHVAVGMDNGFVDIWDVCSEKKIRRMGGHESGSRVGSLAWNSYMLSSGSQDTMIYNHDVRSKNHLINGLKAHEQEICGLEWNRKIDGTRLVSGGNDNIVNVWEKENMSKVKYEFSECKSAVKAVAWCPWQDGLLATGGGTGDRRIRFYDACVGKCVNEIDTLSQVCSLVWNPYDKEILSSHGFSKFQLSIWKYPTLTKTHDLTGHCSRVLHTSLSPDGTMVCSAAADETLRLWKVFDKPSKNDANYSHKQSKLNLHIR